MLKLIITLFSVSPVWQLVNMWLLQYPIPAQALNRKLLNRFLNLISQPKRPGKGTGLGLSLVHGIVEAYGGKIFVNSELGKGANFDVYLPVSETLGRQNLNINADLPSGTERILFVDDELPIAEIGKNMLTSIGYQATKCSSSIEALDLFRSKPDDFDLVITDMTMPGMTGDKLAAEMMKLRPDIPVVLCTGYSSKISDKKAAEIGVQGFLYKPILMENLAKTVRRVLDMAKDNPQG